MKAKKSSRSRASADESALCQYPFADGRQCRMLRAKSHPSLCLFHAREEEQLANADQLGEELASYTGSFRTVSDVNHVVGKLFKLVARNRIPARTAELLAYLSQLLLYSQKGVEYEIKLVHDHDMYSRYVRLAYDSAAQRDRPAASTAPPATPVIAQPATTQPDTPQLEAQNVFNT